jgi:autoinducer 2-degrading protein
MFVTLVQVHVKPEHVADFIESIRANHEGSVREPGNLRFDILQSVDDPARFIAYEAYRDEASAKAHKETAHYLAWRDKVADWMAEPRVGVRYDGLFPELPDQVW